MGERPDELKTPAEAAGEKPEDTLRGYLKRGQQFIEEVLTENEQLRMRVLQLETELETNKEPVPPAVEPNQLREVFDGLHREHDQLQRRLDDITQETKRYQERYREIEEENDRLVNLFIAAHQLHSTLDLASLLQTVVEILLNFVGAGRFAIMVLDEITGKLHAIETYGLPREKVPVVTTEDGAFKQAVETGRPQVSESVGGDWDVKRPRATVPLKVGRRVVGAVAIYSYLKQKREVSPIDRELFALLGDHAGAVMESARVFSSTEVGPRTIDAYSALLEAGGEGA